MKRLLLHVPVGIIIALLNYAHWSLSLCLTYGFIKYELNEDRNIRDEAWRDIIGANIGIVLGGIIVAIF